ncbi:MAG: hypothetical protein IJY09_02890 [Lachnospiraceae bacterium]|nr:hypothetical protein [Lachnospiraceae bacterium]
MFEKLHLEELEGNSVVEVLGKLFEKIPGGSDILEVLKEYAIVLVILGTLLALGQCFAGYKLRRLWTTEVGLVVCGFIGAIVAMQFDLPIGAVIGIAVAATILGAVLAWFLWKVGLFLRVLVTMGITVFAICAMNEIPEIGLIAGAAVGLIVAILVVAFEKPMTIVYTSLAGGFTAAALLSTVEQFGFEWWITLILGVVLMLAGILVQALTNRKSAEPKAQENTTEMLGEFMEGLAADEAAAGAEAPAESAATGEAVPEATEFVTADEAASEVIEFRIPEEVMTEAAAEPMAEIKTELLITEPIAEAVEEVQSAANEEPVKEATVAEPEKNVCPGCGKEYKPGAKFCMICGQKLI